MSEIVHFAFSPAITLDIPVHFGHYEYVDVIGSGSFAIIVEAKDLKTGKSVACKFCYRRFLNDLGILQRFENELRIQEKVSHPNIAPILEVLYLKDVIITVMEYYRWGDLLDMITSMRISEADSIQIAKQLIGALAYMHERGIVHRDIKPENIVLNAFMNPLIIDFGLSTDLNTDSLQTYCGTCFYLPPEIIKGDAYDGKKADIWSLGITIFVVATGTPPWRSNNPNVILKEMENINAILKTSVGRRISNLLSRMLVIDPAKRASAQELMTMFSEREEHGIVAMANLLKPKSFNFPVMKPVSSQKIARINPAKLIMVPTKHRHLIVKHASTPKMFMSTYF